MIVLVLGGVHADPTTVSGGVRADWTWASEIILWSRTKWNKGIQKSLTISEQVYI